MKKLLSAAALAAFAISGHAALENRDLDHNGVTDAFYDTDLKITWLGDANYAKTSGFDLDGKMTWAVANTWANSVTIDGHSGWRLPTALVHDTTCQHVFLGTYARSFGLNCTGSEMGHLSYTELKNDNQSNTLSPTKWGGFQNEKIDDGYWGGTTYRGTAAYGFNFYNGYQGIDDQDLTGYALLVHDGDVSPAPEPETYAMLLAGLGLMGAMTRRRKAQQA